MNRYVAKLIGFEKLETYIENLESQVAFDVERIFQRDEKTYKIFGPAKSSLETEKDIGEDLLKRSQELGLKAPRIVDEVAHEIFCAQEGEIIATNRPMQLSLIQEEKWTSGHIILDLATCGDPGIDECAQQYAILRLNWLADSIGMSFEELPSRIVLQ